jgi:hypothetical protein
MPKKAKTKSYANEVKKGVLTQKQVEKLPAHLLDAIIKSKSKYSKKK